MRLRDLVFFLSLQSHFLRSRSGLRVVRAGLFLLFFTIGLGAELAVAQDAATSAEQSSLNEHVFDDAKWFFYISAGVGRPDYDDEIQGRIDAQKAIGLESPQAGTFDLPGIYRKILPGLAVGGVLHASVENYSRNWRESRNFAIQTYSAAVSALYFTGGKMGEGWFTRADLGPTRFYQRLSEINAANETRVTTSHRDGVFAQLGGGYGWEASHFARVLVHVNAQIASAGPNRLQGATFNIGFLL